jgi:hypothetical protein
MMLRSQKTRHCKGRPTTESGTHSTAPFLRNGGGKPNADLTPSSPESSNTAEVGEAILAPFHNPQWEGNPRPHLSPRGEKRSGLAQMFAVFSTEHMRERERETCRRQPCIQKHAMPMLRTSSPCNLPCLPGRRIFAVERHEATQTGSACPPTCACREWAHRAAC